MPFIITTKRTCRCDDSEHIGSESRRAVAGIEEVNAWLEERAPEWAYLVEAEIPVSIPLADETVEIEPVLWSSLCGALGRGGSSHDPAIWQPEIIAGYNEIIGARGA